MNIDDLKTKIHEVLAAARIVVQRHGHTRKYAKYIVALIVKQLKNGIPDRELAEFLSNDEIGKSLGYRKGFDFTIFSKVRKNVNYIMPETYDLVTSQVMKGKQVRLMAQDSDDVPAHSQNDVDARLGHRTPSKREQFANKSTVKEFVFGYKLHLVADAEVELPLCPVIAPANRNDKKFFSGLYNAVKKRFTINYEAKFLADSQYDSTDVYQELHHDNVKPLIAINGRGHYKSMIPKDREYGKRWAIERIFSRLELMFGFTKNPYIGIKKVSVHIYACLLAYIVKYS